MSGRFGSRSSLFSKVGSMVAVALVTAAGFGLVGASAASAKVPPTTTTTSTSLSPTGRYIATLSAPKQGSISAPLNLTSKGHFSFKGGPKGKWTETGTAITMTGTFHKITFVFTIDQRGANLGSKAHPGKLTADGMPDAKWYAIPG
jgi:hypothetical protein